jgi:putative intracellular protease/amidase/YHS domain-containing protein
MHMQRRELLQLTTSLSLAALLGAPDASAALEAGKAAERIRPLRPPADGQIPVAFLLSEEAVVIDFAGPWEVLDNVQIAGPQPHPFKLFTVAETKAPLHASGGLKIIPDYALSDAPQPKILVIPAQSEPSAAVLDWIRQVAKSADLVMSVCTGAFILAKTGLLDGKSATTHHGAYTELALAYPGIRVERGARYVEVDNLASSGGLTSGIDLTLHVVERYYGRSVAQNTAATLEYQGLGWLDAKSNAEFAKKVVSTPAHPRCSVCGMDVDPHNGLKSVYRGRTYSFCMPSHQQLFDLRPEQFADAS